MKESEFNSLLDILENLIREESRGERFFRDSAAFVIDHKAILLFTRLSEQEVMHRKKLENLRSSLAKKRSSLVRSSSDIRRIEYDGTELPVFFIDAEAETRIETPVLNLFNANEFKELLDHCSVREIIRLAMRIEFDNFKYLVEAARHRYDSHGRQLLMAIADEEKQHYLWLKEYLDSNAQMGTGHGLN